MYEHPEVMKYWTSIPHAIDLSPSAKKIVRFAHVECALAAKR